MFSVDIFENAEPMSIYLSRPDGQIVCALDPYIDEQSSSLTIGLNQQYELHITVRKPSDDHINWFDSIQEGMYLFVERVGLFKMKQPVMTIDGSKETKTVTAYSCDVELEDQSLNIDINMGTKSSQEYLVSYDDGETEALLNPYTGIPYDWIVLYNTFPEQLSNLLTKYNSGYFGDADQSGEVVITDGDLIEELLGIFETIPRLKSKIVESDDDYSLVEYVVFSYRGDSTKVTTVILTDLFRSRINELIQFYGKYRDQLSLISIALEGTHGNWTAGDIYGVSDGDYTLANKKFQFSLDGTTIYSFLTQNLARASNCIVWFDATRRMVNITPIDHVGRNTGIVLTYDNLVNEMNISCDEDTLSTRLYVSGGDDLGIEQVNFGLPYVDDLSYKINVRDNFGRRIYVSDALAEKYNQYIQFREQQRARYIQLSKDIRNYSSKISELTYRVPSDSLKTDWGTFSQDELDAALTTYKNLLASLISLYRNDYGATGINEDGSVDERYIKNTPYWYDYIAYQDTITEIQCAIATFPYYGDGEKWTSTQKDLYADSIHAWETEWSLYGISELRAKIESYKQNMDALAESAVTRINKTSTQWEELTDEQKQGYSNSDICYYYGVKPWAELSNTEKSEYGNLASNYHYDTYMTFYQNAVEAQEYLNTLQLEVDRIQESQSAAQAERLSIVKSVSPDGYFTEYELKILSLLVRTAEYSNENILTTSIDTSDDEIDSMLELLHDGQEQVSILSRPQLTFSVSAVNLLGLPEYRHLWDDFKTGNYILVQYKDNTFVRLRLVSYTFNPSIPASEQLEMVFSNYVRSSCKVTDLEYLLGVDDHSSSGGRSSSGSSSGGGYGESDDIDPTISNTMIAKMLNSETFGTRVKDVVLNTIDVNAITAKQATFTGLYQGSTIIDGSCIQTGCIYDRLYRSLVDAGTITLGSVGNTSGSVINLNDGKFNLGGGNLKWDGTALSVAGAITATSLSTGSRTGSGTGQNGIFIDSSGNMYAGSNNQTKINADGTFNLGSGKLVYDGSTLTFGSDVTIGWSQVTGTSNIATKSDIRTDAQITQITKNTVTTAYVNALKITANSVAAENITGTTISGKTISGGSINIGSSFTVSNTGVLNCSGAVINGKITAGENSDIGGWAITSGKIYGGDSSTGVAVLQRPSSSTTYVFAAGGTSHESYKDCPFRVTKTGNLYANSARFGGNIYLYDDNDESPILSIKVYEDRKTIRFGDDTAYNTHIYTKDNVYKNGSTTTYFQTTSGSDERLKTNKCDVSEAYEKLFNEVGVKTYEYILKDSESQGTYLGFMAGDIMKLAKRYGVHEDSKLWGSVAATEAERAIHGDDVTYNVNYLQWVPLTVHMVQIANRRIEELERAIQKLTDK